jgi:hypothetical protein
MLTRAPLYIAVFSLVAVMLLFIFTTRGDPEHPMTSWFGNLGDFSGGVLGGLSVVLIVANLFLQQEALKEQRRGQVLTNALDALKYITPDLESMARRIAENARLVVQGGALEDFQARFQSGERSIYLVRILTGQGQLRAFLQNENGNPDVIASINRVIDRYCAEFSIVTTLLDSADTKYIHGMRTAILATTPGRVFCALKNIHE